MSTDGNNTAIGILDAGRVGTVLASLAVTAGLRALLARSGDPATIAPIVDDELRKLLDLAAPGVLATKGYGVMNTVTLLNTAGSNPAGYDNNHSPRDLLHEDRRRFVRGLSAYRQSSWSALAAPKRVGSRPR